MSKIYTKYTKFADLVTKRFMAPEYGESSNYKKTHRYAARAAATSIAGVSGLTGGVVAGSVVVTGGVVAGSAAVVGGTVAAVAGVAGGVIYGVGKGSYEGSKFVLKRSKFVLKKVTPKTVQYKAANLTSTAYNRLKEKADSSYLKARWLPHALGGRTLGEYSKGVHQGSLKKTTQDLMKALDPNKPRENNTLKEMVKRLKYKGGNSINAAKALDMSKPATLEELNALGEEAKNAVRNRMNAGSKLYNAQSKYELVTGDKNSEEIPTARQPMPNDKIKYTFRSRRVKQGAAGVGLALGVLTSPWGLVIGLPCAAYLGYTVVNKEKALSEGDKFRNALNKSKKALGPKAAHNSVGIINADVERYESENRLSAAEQEENSYLTAYVMRNPDAAEYVGIDPTYYLTDTATGAAVIDPITGNPIIDINNPAAVEEAKNNLKAQLAAEVAAEVLAKAEAKPEPPGGSPPVMPGVAAPVPAPAEDAEIAMLRSQLAAEKAARKAAESRAPAIDAKEALGGLRPKSGGGFWGSLFGSWAPAAEGPKTDSL